ncbi:MAG: septal ring lytic transglycosylase RlpA family protein [Mariprofundaceae bacterium]
MRFVVIAVACFVITACAQARVSYSPLPNVHVSVPLNPPSSKMASGKAGKLPTGSGGHYKTGKPYQVAGRWYYPLSSASAYDRTGIASWYGRDFHGKKTANGERYDMHALSAAHKTLPLPTLMRVTNLENGRSVIVRVNDRGPFVKNRLIDLSYAAARSLGYVDKGTARVRVQALASRPAQTIVQHTIPAAAPVAPPKPAAASPAPAGVMYVQLGAFSSQDNAKRLKNVLLQDYPDIRIYHISDLMPVLYRVRIGPFDNVKQIEQVVISLRNNGYDNAIVVIE